MNNEHEATPKYLQFLEWHLQSELRRKARFGEPAARASRWPQRFRAAAMIAVSLFAGAGVVVASEQIGDAQRSEIWLRRNRIQLEVAERRVEAADKELARINLLVERGLLSSTALAGQTRERAGLERGAQHLRLDREEIMATGEPVSSAETISARAAGRRDFVAEHLGIELVFAQGEAGAAGLEAERVRRLADAGFVSATELDQAEAAMELTELDVTRLQRRLGVRIEFSASAMSVEECERRAMIGEVEHRQAVASKRVEALERQLRRAEKAEAAGFARRVVAPLRVELDAVRAEARLAERELELLRSPGR